MCMCSKSAPVRYMILLLLCFTVPALDSMLHRIEYQCMHVGKSVVCQGQYCPTQLLWYEEIPSVGPQDVAQSPRSDMC